MACFRAKFTSAFNEFGCMGLEGFATGMVEIRNKTTFLSGR
jgi:hypothetical protein